VLCAYRFLPLWFGWGYLKAYGVHPRLPDYCVMLFQGLLLPLFVLGVRRLGRISAPLAAGVVAIALVHMAMMSQLRFILPVMPVVMAVSVAGLLRRKVVSSPAS